MKAYKFQKIQTCLASYCIIFSLITVGEQNPNGSKLCKKIINKDHDFYFLTKIFALPDITRPLAEVAVSPLIKLEYNRM